VKPPVPPLRVVILRAAADADGGEFHEAVRRAFVGSPSFDGNAPSVTEDLRVDVREFTDVPMTRARTALSEALHSLVVVWSGAGLAANAPLVTWISDAWGVANNSHGRHAFFVLGPNQEAARGLVSASGGALEHCQVTSLETLDEPAARPMGIALLALQRAQTIVRRGLRGPAQPGKVRFFISHAKRDGYALARSMMRVIDGYAWLSSFYDARDIESGSNWKDELRTAVSNSMLLVVRTNTYDARHWCQAEAEWAEEYGVPIVVIEARSDLYHPATGLALERAPCVRIPDGNLLRVLHVAAREHLRSLLVRRGADQFTAGRRIVVLPRVPSLLTLEHAAAQLALKKKAGRRTIVYPDPPLPVVEHAAAEALVRGRVPGAKLLSYSQLLGP
jgi:hypothetical protein